jgi:hypothetical protein
MITQYLFGMREPRVLPVVTYMVGATHKGKELS